MSEFLHDSETLLTLEDAEKDNQRKRLKWCKDKGKICAECMIQGACEELTVKLFPKGVN